VSGAGDAPGGEDRGLPRRDHRAALAEVVRDQGRDPRAGGHAAL
jgi:hypothetical protein